MRLLLNEQINPQVATELRNRGYDIVAATEAGTRGASDSEQLAAAASDRRAIVSYNIADFQELFAEWAQRGLTHYGIVFVSEKTIPQRAVGPLVRALERVLKEYGSEDALLNQALYLARTAS